MANLQSTTIYFSDLRSAAEGMMELLRDLRAALGTAPRCHIRTLSMKASETPTFTLDFEVDTLFVTRIVETRARTVLPLTTGPSWTRKGKNVTIDSVPDLSGETMYDVTFVFLREGVL